MSGARCIRSLLLACVMAMSACSPSPSRSGTFAPVADVVRERAGHAVAWGDGRTEVMLTEATERALADSVLTADEAVTLALLRNPTLQARFERLGIARAQVISAGLIPNPVLDVEVSFLEGGGGEIIELTIAQGLLDLLLMPRRKEVAAARLERARAEAVGSVLDLAAETRTAYRRLQAQVELADLSLQLAEAAAVGAEMAERLIEAGNIPPVDATRAMAAREASRQRRTRALAEAARMRSNLAVLMGLTGNDATRWSVPAGLPEPGPLAIAPADVERSAVEASVDLRAARARVTEAGRLAGLREFESVVPEASAGVTSEREPDGEWSVGPILSVPIPVFNWGQGVSAEQRARVRMAIREHEATALRVRHAARDRYTRSESGAAAFRHLRDTLVPLRSRVTQQTLEQVNAMQIGVFDLLEARTDEIETSRQRVTVLRDHWVARIELESILLGRVPRGGYGLDRVGGTGGAAGGGMGAEDGGGH